MQNKETTKKQNRIGPEFQPLFLKYKKDSLYAFQASEQASEEWDDSQRCIVNDYAKVERERALSVFFWNREASSTATSAIVLFWGLCFSVSLISGTFRAN